MPDVLNTCNREFAPNSNFSCRIYLLCFCGIATASRPSVSPYVYLSVTLK